MESISRSDKSSGSESDIFEFKKYAEQLAEILHLNNAPVRAYDNPSLPIFSQLDSERRKKSISQIRHYHDSVVSSLDANKNINEKQSLWSSLRLLGFRPTSDILDYVDAQDSVEAYDAEGIQFWRNIKFLKVCSYSFEEIFSIPWHDRYDRNAKALQMTQELAMNLMKGKVSGTLQINIRNVIVEKLSMKKFVINANHKTISPLYDSANAVSGFIVVSSVDLVGSRNLSVADSVAAELTH